MRLAGEGMTHNRNRAYNPGIGRFMQADPIGQNGGLNIYAYVGGDPVNFGDPLGLARTKVCTTKPGSRIERCVWVETDQPIGPTQARRLGARYHLFIANNGSASGVDISGFGKSVSGGTRSQRSIVQAVTQFVGAAVARYGTQSTQNAWAAVTGIIIGRARVFSSGGVWAAVACVDDDICDGQLGGSNSDLSAGTVIVNPGGFFGGGRGPSDWASTVLHESQHFNRNFMEGGGFDTAAGLGGMADYNHDVLRRNVDYFNYMVGLDSELVCPIFPLLGSFGYTPC